ncbi:MAG: hypothetical protein R3C32_11480 [Chloroflexota bacterium]
MLAALLAVVLVLSASIVTGVRATALPPAPTTDTRTLDAADGSGDACTGQPAFKAVIVVGPVGGETTRFKAWADEIATAARDAGMSVCKVYSPYADDDTVKAAVKGADLFRGSDAWQRLARPLRPKDPDKSDGTADPRTRRRRHPQRPGLNATEGDGNGNPEYYGADWVRGTCACLYHRRAQPHVLHVRAIPRTSTGCRGYALAVEHMSNFAAGFLDSGEVPERWPPERSHGPPRASTSIPEDRKGNLIDTLMTRDVAS